MIRHKFKKTSLELTMVKWLSALQHEIHKVHYRVEGKPNEPYWVKVHAELTTINESIKTIKKITKQRYS